MISTSKFCAIAFIAAIGLASGFASPTFAANYGPQNYAPYQSGGGSAGYNHNLSTDYRLKHHTRSHYHSQQ